MPNYFKDLGNGISAKIVQLGGTDIVLPVELRGKEKTFLFTTTANLALNAVFISPVYDSILKGRFSGFVSANQAGTLYIQETDDEVTWYTTSKIAVPIAASEPISSITYYEALPFNVETSARKVRLVYVNGGVAQTRFQLSAYLRPI